MSVVPKFYYSKFYISEKTECDLMKIKQTCLNGTRILKAFGPASKNKINARWIFWVFKACEFINEVHQIEIVAETFFM